MVFNNNEIKLIIFDLDGTLIDSTSLWFEVDKEFFENRGMEVPENYAKEIAHIGLRAAAVHTKNKYFPNEEIEDILNEWNLLSLKGYEETIPLKENAKELLELLYNSGITLALATANSKSLYEPCIKRLDIEKYFSFVIDVNSCKEGKNSPEIYDKICHRFNVEKENTLVFEDSLTALITAYDAGYNVVAVYDVNSTKDLAKTTAKSHYFIKNFKEIIDFFN